MAIVTTKHDSGEVTEKFAGRVIEVRTFLATRNMSDTLDYTDFRSVECTEALVWLGTHHRFYPWEEEKALAFHQQFTWVDVSNHFAFRNGESSKAAADAVMGVNGEPLMWANLIAWRNYVVNQKLIADKAAAEAAEARRIEAAAKAAKAAARALKNEAKKAATEAEQLAKAPPNGTAVKVGSFTGKVFWIGTKKYRGTWSVRLGVKGTRGTVVWCGVDDVVRV